MVENHNEKELKTAAEYRQLAEEHKRAWIYQMKTFLLVGIIAIVVLIIGYVMTVAWFIVNQKTAITGHTVATDINNLELRSYGSAGVHDDLLSNIENLFYSIGTEGSFTTNGDNQTINWLLSEDSNMKNIKLENGHITSIDWTSTDEERKNYAIEPGAKGQLQFYVVPAADGKQTVEFQLELLAYQVPKDENKNITKATLLADTGDALYAKQFLAGHVLFYLEKEDDSLFWIKDGSFSLVLGDDTVAGQECGPYTIKWLWPQTFGEIILKSGDRFLNGKTPIDSRLSSQILEDAKINAENHFFNGLTQAPLAKDSTWIQSLDDIINDSKDLPNTAQIFIDLNSFYNQADQKIGENISFIIVKLTGSAGGSTE